MLETSARLLHLLSLLQAQRFWTGAELAERLEVTDRTLRRDIDRLRTLGYPVDATPGVAGGYQLGAGAALPPLLLSDDEALAVSLGLRTASHRISGLDDAGLSALVKLERVLPPRLRRRADALRASIVQLERAGPHVDSELLATLAAACQEHREALFGYTTRGKESSERRVEPAGLVHTGYRWYLVAWDTGRRGWRTFRVDRVNDPVELGKRFVPQAPPEGGDLKRYVSQSVAVDVYSHQARVVFAAPIEAMLERVSATSGVLERVDAKRCRLTTGGHSLQSLAIHLALLDTEFYVEEPAELARYLRMLSKRLARAASPPRQGHASAALKNR